jgi:hypothetical protein
MKVEIKDPVALRKGIETQPFSPSLNLVSRRLTYQDQHFKRTEA